MKKIKYLNNFSEEELNIIKTISSENGISQFLAQLMFIRGVQNSASAKEFLNAGKRNFTPPTNLTGVKEAVERINSAIKKQEKILIFGDYDVDGICATTITYKAIKALNYTATCLVPEREGGYGLAEAGLKRIIGENPKLLITVDCGINSYKETKMLQDLGIDVIITDHHELPEILPDTIVINPKIDGGRCKNLCGAGVAFKLATALIGDKAYDFLDLTALATVADSMVMLEENRDIVFEGLKNIERGKVCPAINYLINTSKNVAYNTQFLAYSLAPKINSAGRLNSAKTALDIFLEEDEKKILEGAFKLQEFNAKRQEIGEEMYALCKEMLEKDQPNGRAIILKSEKFHPGLLGIVCAKLVEDYSKVVVLFCEMDGKLKGSARSSGDVNIFEVFSNCKSLIYEFGGHAQAAGLVLENEKFDAFKLGVEEYLINLSPESFQPTYLCDKRLQSGDLTKKMIGELELLEPCGTGNKKPLFSMEISGEKFLPMKNEAHIHCQVGDVDFMYFGAGENLDILNTPLKKELIFELGINEFRGNIYHKGFIKNFITNVEISPLLEVCVFRNNILNLKKDNFVEVEFVESLDFIYGKGKNLYAVCDLNNLPNESFLDMPLEFLRARKKKAGGNLVVGFCGDGLEWYDNLIYLDEPEKVVANDNFKGKVYVLKGKRGYNYLKDENLDRNALGEVFLSVKDKSGIKAKNSVEAYFAFGENFSYRQFIIALEVFEEIGIISYNFGKFTVINKKSNLEDSKIYCGLKNLQNKG